MDRGQGTTECSILGDSIVTIQGLNFGSATTGNATVLVGGLPCSGVSYLTPHTRFDPIPAFPTPFPDIDVISPRLRCMVPANAAGGFNVSVAVTVASLTGYAFSRPPFP